MWAVDLKCHIDDHLKQTALTDMWLLDDISECNQYALWPLTFAGLLLSVLVLIAKHAVLKQNHKNYKHICVSHE